MKLSEEYSQQIISLSNEINQSLKKLGVIAYNKQLLNIQKSNIVQKIEQTNKEKDDLISRISAEYGQGYVDPTTWQFHPANKKEDDDV